MDYNEQDRQEALQAMEKVLKLQSRFGVKVPSLNWHLKKWDDGTFTISQIFSWEYDEQGRQAYFITRWFYEDTIHPTIWKIAQMFAIDMAHFQEVYFEWWRHINSVTPPSPTEAADHDHE